MAPALYIGIAVLVLLQIADLWTTSRFDDGPDDEANPVGRWAWRRFGFWSLIVGKVVVTAGVIAYTFAFPVTWVTGVVLVVGIFMMAFVVISNLENAS